MGRTRFVNMVQCHFLRGFVNMQVGGILAVCVLAMAASARPHGIRIPEGLADAVVPETELTGIGPLAAEIAAMQSGSTLDSNRPKFLIFKISDSRRSFEFESRGDCCATLDEFVSKLPDKQCRFAVVNMPTDGYQITNLVFINVRPDDAPIRDKMIYASFKERFKNDVLDNYVRRGQEYLAQCSDSNACFTGQRVQRSTGPVFTWASPPICDSGSNRERTMFDKCGGYVCEPGEVPDWEGCC